jgi:hypothetical protein
MRVTRKRQIALVLLAGTWGVLYTYDHHLALLMVGIVLVVVFAVWLLDALGWWP